MAVIAPSFWGGKPGEDLLLTKLAVPPPRRALVARPRLLEQLDAGLGYPLTLVAAPAGFGKTTLLAEWLAARRDGAGPVLLVAWVSLDAADNDPMRFAAYVMAALRGLHPEIVEDVLTALRSPQPPPLEAALTVLVNELGAVPSDAVLVLDDYHAIHSRTIHETLAFLVEHLPPQIHLVVASRADPPLPLARLRARGQLVEVRADDLRFAPAEAAAFLNVTMGLDLTPEEVTALEARTEGWPAGLQLAALAFKGRTDASEFVAAFAGSHRYVLTYFVDDVLARQPAPVQTFLLQTAILDRLCAPLCDAVTGRADGEAMLARLERENLFVVALDDSGHWYRYHHLFAEVLRHRLRQTSSGIIPQLHRLASAWHEGQGLLAEAIEHAFATPDLERAVGMVEKAAPALLGRGEAATLQGWMARLSADVVSARPRLCLARAQACLLACQLDTAEACLEDAERALRLEDHAGIPVAELPRLQGEAAALRTYLALTRNDYHLAVQLSWQALAQVPEEDAVVRGILALDLGRAHQLGGDLAAAAQSFGEARAYGLTEGNQLLALFALFSLGTIQELQGELRKAESTHREVERLAHTPEGQPLPIGALAHARLGRLHREWNDLETATRHLEAALELGRRGGVEGAVLDGCLSLALVRQARGDVLEADALIRQAGEIARGWSVPEMALSVAAHEAQLRLRTGDLESAKRWARGCPPDVGSDLTELAEIRGSVLARVLLAEGQSEEAKSLLDRMLAVAERRGRTPRVIELLVLQALTHQTLGDRPAAVSTLERALSLAEPEGYVRTFLDEGEQVIDLLRRVAGSSSPVASLALRLLAASLEQVPATSGAKPEPTSAALRLPIVPLVESLSERELEVLRLIGDGLSNRQIADRLVISVATAKKHVENVHGKLGVHSRTQALARAQELRLL